MRNKHPGTCYKCGKPVLKGKGHPEKTNAHHRKLGVVSKWVIRCTQCAGVQFAPKSVDKIANRIVNGTLNTNNYTVDAWFDEKGAGTFSFYLSGFREQTITMTTTLTSHKPDDAEINQKQAAFKARIEQIKSAK